MYQDEVIAKMQAAQQQKAYENQAQCGVAPIGGVAGRAQYTVGEEAEKSAHYHYEQADKANRAACFLRENPAFDEFIRLVRSGAIQF